MSKGIILAVGQVVVLAIDNTMVYVEAVTPTFASVVALPQQPATRTDDRVFTPGKVGAKKISPFSLPDENFPDSDAGVIPVPQLSQRNKDFIGAYEKLRADNGPNFVDQTDEEKKLASAGGVKKVKPPKADRAARTAERAAAKLEKKAKREADRAAAAAPPSCAGCDAGYFRTANGVHYAGADEQAPLWGICSILLGGIKQPRVKTPKDPAAPKAARTPKGNTNKSALKFRIINDSLATASAEKDKFKAGNRGHKVYQALTQATADHGDVVTVEQVMAKAAQLHGADWSNDPEGVCYNALNDLTKDALGNVTELVK